MRGLGAAWRPNNLRGEAMRGQHHAGTKTSGRNASAVVSVIVVTLLILLVIVIILELG
jgi:hypothetical protein